MTKMKIQNAHWKNQINEIDITNDTLTGRGGLAFILRYLDNIGIWNLFEQTIGHLRKSGKSKSIATIIRQIIISFIDGSDNSMKGFDRLRTSPEYAKVLEYDTEDLAGESMIRRFFRKFLGTKYFLLRPILHHLFIWRLHIEKPKVIRLYIDTMVLDNDQALIREGCNPTYKKVKGFQPLQVHWGRYMIDMMFRSGEKHSNYGAGVSKCISKLVDLIRTKYSVDVPIIVNCDSGFLSDENFNKFETLGIHYIGMGKLYDYLYDQLQDIDLSTLPTIEGTKASWAYYEFGSRFKNKEYTKFRKTIFTTLAREGEQTVLRGIRPDSFIHTNIGTNPLLDKKLIDSGHAHLLETAEIIRLAHSNGAEELNHRSIKDFMNSEHLPFKRFGMNAAYYSLMAIAHFLMEAYCQDVGSEIVPRRCYPKTYRRILIDFAAKIIRTSGKTILKVTQTVWNQLKIQEIWERCNHPIPLLIT